MRSMPRGIVKDECRGCSPPRHIIISNGIKVLPGGRRPSTSSDEWAGIKHLHPGCIQLGMEVSIC
jgi:hypothetical protein